MTNEELNRKLKQLNTEDYIWLVYIGIIFMSWYANTFERKYFINNDLESKEKYQRLLVLIFVILIFAYLYFFKQATNDLKNLKASDTYKKKKLIFLSFLGTLLILISGFIFLYIALEDENIDVELAFS